MRNMQGQKFISRVNFEATKHHRQLIRQQIKPELFQQLEVSHNPAANYLNACKGVFKDELEKTMEQHLQKKMKNQYEHLDDKAAYSMNPMTQSRLQEHHMANSCMNNQNSRQPFNHQPMNRLQINHFYENNRNQYQKPANSPINCSKFRDYNEERTNKFESHIKNTFDGGKQFFKIHDAYQEKKVKETQNYADFLRKQVEQKKYSKLSQRQKQNMQHMAYKQMQSYQAELDKQKYMRQYENKSYQKMDKMHEVEQQRLRKQGRSQQFQYNSIALHNPITNPIEYHIDNPYILKKIQDRSGL